MRRLLLCLSLTLSLPAFAQFGAYVSTYSSGVWNNPMSATMDSLITLRIQQRMVERRVGQPTPTAKPAPRIKKPTQALAATDFKPTKKRTMVDAFAQSVKSPEERADLAEGLTEVMQVLEKEPDFRKNNVAYALGLVLAGSIFVTTGHEMPEVDAEGLVYELATTLAASPEFKKLSPRAKQDIYESALITFGLMAAIHQEGEEDNDVPSKQLAKAMARAVLEQYGVKL